MRNFFIPMAVILILISTSFQASPEINVNYNMGVIGGAKWRPAPTRVPIDGFAGLLWGQPIEEVLETLPFRLSEEDLTDQQEEDGVLMLSYSASCWEWEPIAEILVPNIARQTEPEPAFNLSFIFLDNRLGGVTITLDSSSLLKPEDCAYLVKQGVRRYGKGPIRSKDEEYQCTTWFDEDGNILTMRWIKGKTDMTIAYASAEFAAYIQRISEQKEPGL